MTAANTPVGWRFAIGKRWLGYIAMAIVFAIACVALSAWQVARRNEALVAMEKVASNYDQAAVPLGDLLPDRSGFDEGDEWRSVVVTGTYLADEQLLVRNRPFNSQPGFEVLTPLALDDGSIFIVDRGWLPTGDAQDYPDVVPEAPLGTVEVVVHLKAGEPSLLGRSAPAGQIATIELSDMASRVDAPTYTGAYGLLASESPSVAQRPAAAPKPQLDEGNHLSYAFQWLVFAVIGFAGLGYAIRQEYRVVNADDPAEQERALERSKRAAARRPSDGEIEDSILDSAPRR